MTVILKSDQAEQVSQWLMDINAISYRPDPPYVFTSGWKSPIYVNCRKIISHVAIRNAVVQLLSDELRRHVDVNDLDVLAGGETAGIPYAAWISAAMSKPMIYVRKKQKEFGLEEYIVGDLAEGSKCVLVEDSNTDATSKIHFSNVVRASGGKIQLVACVFNYGVFPHVEETLKESGLQLLCLTDWPTTIEVGIRNGYFGKRQAAALDLYLRDPVGWSASH